MCERERSMAGIVGRATHRVLPLAAAVLLALLVSLLACWPWSYVYAPPQPRKLGQRIANSTVPSEALETCGGRRLEAGYVLVFRNWEQQTAGSANLMSLQCWVATLNMVVVEYFMVGSRYMVPVELLVSANAATPHQFVRLRQIYDIDYWNKYSREECYAPLVKWENFLCNAPREAIVVHIAYAKYTRPYELNDCPPSHQYKDSFVHKHSPFFSEHGFRIIREVCLEARRSLTTRALNEFVLGGNRTSKVTLMINVWRGASYNGVRVRMTDTKCNRNNYLAMEFAMPSAKILEDVRLYRERVLGNNNYLAVMVRLELAIRELRTKPRNTWSLSQCLKGLMSLWTVLKKSNSLEETFWSFDIGTYGTVGYKLVYGNESEHMTEEVFNFLKHHYNSSYSNIEESLSKISGIRNAGYIASLQLNIAVRANCLLLVGGGSFQNHARIMHTSVHKGAPCIVQKETRWLTKQCLSNYELFDN